MTSSVMGRFVPVEAPPTARRQRLLMITCEFPPNGAVAGQVCWQIAQYLPRYGWDPVVLTARDRDLQARDVSPDPLPVVRTGALPHPFTVYRRLKARIRPATAGAASSHEGASAHAADAGMGGLRRLVLSLGYAPDEYSGWIVPAVMAGLRAIRRHRIEHLFSSSPHSTSQLVGLVLARLSRLPWTAHFQDPWTYPRKQWQEVKPVTALSAWLETALEGMVVRRADVVACVTEEHTNRLRQRYPDQPADKFITNPNGFDGDEWESVERESREARRDKFVITYAGSIYNLRSPLPLFRALRSLIDSGDIARDHVQVDLIGNVEGVQVREMAAACGLVGCVRITGLLGRAETLRRMAQSDLLLLLAGGMTHQIPLKTYEYLRAGRPILALTPQGAIANLLRRTGGAWVVDPADDRGIAAAVREAYRLWEGGFPGPGPDRELVASFDRRALVGRLAEILRDRSGQTHLPAEKLLKS
jgi:glycosyltransferase involved in cell wall biosynthesis